MLQDLCFMSWRSGFYPKNQVLQRFVRKARFFSGQQCAFAGMTALDMTWQIRKLAAS
jgi:hypothetical protein